MLLKGVGDKMLKEMNKLYNKHVDGIEADK